VAGTASFDPDQRTYRALAKACFRHPCANQWLKRILFTCLGVITVYFVWRIIEILWQSRGPEIALTDLGQRILVVRAMILVFLILYLSFHLTSWRSRAIGRWWQKRLYAGRIHVEWDYDWLRLRDGDSVNEKAWSNVHSAREMGEQLVIYFRDTSVVVVPMKAFLDGQLSEIYGIVESASSGRAP
jgi:hypothetical protein